MKHVIRNKNVLELLEKPIEKMKREPKGIANFSNDYLRCYRDVWKVTARFNWNNEEGESWRDILRASARAEFEQIKEENDPLIIGKFLITWRDAINRMHEKVNDVNMKMTSFVDETRTDSVNQKAFDPFKDRNVM
ncbi:unnamed protein product [Moneuplotes crassus]|uniref:Uncharacterized protein n=1 Tax=Euplotes crassus TaxID=5936 RepID=A0AAD2D819_EUPCR|nr:unnamed protein product [Moneuplotes crassus]